MTTMTKKTTKKTNKWLADLTWRMLNLLVLSYLGSLVVLSETNERNQAPYSLE